MRYPRSRGPCQHPTSAALIAHPAAGALRIARLPPVRTGLEGRPLLRRVRETMPISNAQRAAVRSLRRPTATSRRRSAERRPNLRGPLPKRPNELPVLRRESGSAPAPGQGTRKLTLPPSAAPLNPMRAAPRTSAGRRWSASRRAARTPSSALAASRRAARTPSSALAASRRAARTPKPAARLADARLPARLPSARLVSARQPAAVRARRAVRAGRPDVPATPDANVAGT